MKILATYIDERDGNDCSLRDAYFELIDNGNVYILRHSTVSNADIDEWQEVAAERLDPEILRHLANDATRENI